MATEPKRKAHQSDQDRGEREHREKMLDDALENTFPASDPVSIVPSTPTAGDRDRDPGTLTPRIGRGSY